MKSQILLYNIPQAKMSKLRVLCMRLGLKMHPVAGEDYAKTLTQLLDIEGAAPAEAPADAREPFTDEMLVMCGFDQRTVDELLTGMRRERIPVIPLKAVLTETNQNWTSYQLHDEISAEREALRAGKKAHQK